MKIRTFKNKKQIEDYLKNKFKSAKIILIRGSTAYKKARAFSDFDVESYGKIKKPYYEIVLLNKNPILMSVYFYKYISGNKINPPKNTKILLGEFNENIGKRFNSSKHFAKSKYNQKEKIIRECQIIIDFMFKYLRSKNKKYLESVQKRIK